MTQSESPIYFQFPESLWLEESLLKHYYILKKIRCICGKNVSMTNQHAVIHQFRKGFFCRLIISLVISSFPPFTHLLLYEDASVHTTHCQHIQLSDPHPPTPCDWPDSPPVSWNLSYLIWPCAKHMRHSELISHSQRLSSFLIFF